MSGDLDAEESPTEAAFRADAQDVYSASYSKGFEAGWTRGWLEALAEDCDSDVVEAQDEPLSGLDAGDRHEQENTPGETLELSEEWAEIFAMGAASRAAAAAAASAEAQSEARRAQIGTAKTTVDLGGIAEAQRRREAERLYGARASEILAANAALDAQFADASSEAFAPLWPAVSLADVFGRNDNYFVEL